MTVSNEPPKQAAILPIGETTSEIFRVFGDNLNRLVGLALWPVALSAASYAAVVAAGNNAIISLLGAIVDLAIYTLFAVAWHRLILLSNTEETSAPWAWESRHSGFFGYALLVNIIVYAIIFLPLLVAGVSLNEFLGEGVLADGEPMPELSEEAIAEIASAVGVIFVLMLIVWYLFLRLSFVFPAQAVDEKYGLGDSWRHTRGNGLRLMAISFLTIAPAYLVATIAMALLVSLADLIGGVAGAVVASVVLAVAITIVVVALTVTLASVAFRRATGWVPGPIGGPSV